MKKSYALYYPPEIIFGTGKMSELPAHLPNGSNVLLITGKHAEKSGLQKMLIDLLEAFEVTTIAGVTPEPPLEEVDKLLETGRSKKITAVVAAGGGSVIDAAKAAACLIPKEGNASDYFYGKKEISEKGLFFAALPTTAGTGAEITKNSVLTDAEAKIKKSIRHPTMVPDLAIIDPQLTVSAPPGLTAASGLDAYTQAVESYISANANHVTKALAKKAVELIYKSLPQAFKNPGDINARAMMAEGSMISAMAFSQSGLGAVHGLAHPLGSLLNIPHGETCAILLGPVLKWNKPECEKEYAELALVCEGGNSENFINNTVKLCSALGIPQGFAKHGLAEEHFPFILKNCRSNSMTSNPRHMTDKNITNMLTELAKG